MVRIISQPNVTCILTYTKMKRKSLFILLGVLTVTLSACGNGTYCQNSPFCYNPGGNIGIVNLMDILRVSVHQGETVSVPIKLDFGKVPPSESLLWVKMDAAAKSSTNPNLIAVVNGDVEVSAVSNPFVVDGALMTTLSFKASSAAQLGTLPGQTVRIHRTQYPNAQTDGGGTISITVLPKQ